MSDNIQVIISIVTGILLTISEVLPFFKNLNSNGIIHLLMNISQNKTTLLHEIEPLLNISPENPGNEENHNNKDNRNNENNEIKTNLRDINDTLSYMTNKIYDNLNNVIDNSRTLKLQPSELYELNYIINYIKSNYPKKSYITKYLGKTNKQLLISQGYIIDYDMQHDTYIIKW